GRRLRGLHTRGRAVGHAQPGDQERAEPRRPRLAGYQGGPLGAAVLDRIAEVTRDREQPLEVEVDPRTGLLRHLVLDRQVEVVGAVVEGAERVLVLRQDRGADVLDVVEEDPRERDVAPVLLRRDLTAAERGPVRLVRPAEEREQAAKTSSKALVLEVPRAL